jgi:hypothetical protein
MTLNPELAIKAKVLVGLPFAMGRWKRRMPANVPPMQRQG